MPFKSGKSGNPNGRPKADQLVNPKSVSGEAIREKELKKILRRLAPLNNKALLKAEQLLDADNTTEAGKIKLMVFFMKTYQDILDDLYKPVYGKDNLSDDNDEEKDDLSPIVQFKVLGDKGV